MTSRRKFIRDAGLATAGLAFASSSFANFYIGKKPKVIIIGAGFSGLAAAYKLFLKKIDFVILESRDRVGGRVFSHQFDPTDNLVVELGAEWVGASHSRIHELCKTFELELQDNRFESHLIYKGRYYRNTEWNYSDQWKTKFKTLLEEYPKLTQDDKLKLDKMDWWRYLVNNGCEGMDLDLRELFDSTDFGETIRSVSAFAALAEYAESSEKNEMDFKIKGGNASLARKFAAAIGEDKINLGTKVSRIVQKTNGPVTVYCESGESFTADKIICTAPTFAISKIKWEPGLPLEYQQALNELQYARINKNPILFSERFWKAEDFDMITDQTPHYFYHATKNQKSSSGALISYTIGEKAALIANQSEEWKADMLAQTLDPFFGPIKPRIKSQTNYYWGNDALSKGAYAIYGKGQWFRVQSILKKSHIHTYFAGEHLADWQGFMEGAINTGESAASKVLL